MLNQLINTSLIELNLQAKTKNEVFTEMINLLAKQEKINSKEQFLADIYTRENIANTGFEKGIAIPHAKSTAVTSPAIVVGISREGIEYGAEDGKPSHIFFMIASPEKGNNDHIEALANISGRIIEEKFLEKLLVCKTSQEAYDLIINKKEEPEIIKKPLMKQSNESKSIKRSLIKAKEHLLCGTSHMIPFIVSGGVLFSLAVMLSGKGATPTQGILGDIATMGIAGFTLFTAVLGGYIAFSIADKPGLAPGMLGSYVAVQYYQTGFLGAIIVGFFAGWIVCQLQRIKLPDAMRSLGSIFIYPLVGTFLTCGFVMWGIGGPIAALMDMLNAWLSSMAGSGKVMLGAILGGMTAFDMGGPINKVATLFAQTQVDTQPWLMGGVGIAICVPPLGLALATFLSPKKFRSEERDAGKAAVIMGMIGITEGAIPFAAADPIRVIPSIVVGGIVGNVVGFLFNVINHAPWGGWIVLPVVEGKLGYIVGTLAGALVTAMLVVILKKEVTEDEKSVIADEDDDFSTISEGEAQILAITSCPSGVAHTFLAAKSLEKAGKAMGMIIKVETQGADGIKNRITAKDVENADAIIFAHDVAIKDLTRFDSLPQIDVGTKDAMRDAQALIRQVTSDLHKAKI